MWIVDCVCVCVCVRARKVCLSGALSSCASNTPAPLNSYTYTYVCVCVYLRLRYSRGPAPESYVLAIEARPYLGPRRRPNGKDLWSTGKLVAVQLVPQFVVQACR